MVSMYIQNEWMMFCFWFWLCTSCSDGRSILGGRCQTWRKEYSLLCCFVVRLCYLGLFSPLDVFRLTCLCKCVQGNERTKCKKNEILDSLWSEHTNTQITKNKHNVTTRESSRVESVPPMVLDFGWGAKIVLLAFARLISPSPGYLSPRLLLPHLLANALWCNINYFVR